MTLWRFHNRAWQPERRDRLPETSGTLWIHRGALTNQRCSLATGCGITAWIPSEVTRTFFFDLPIWDSNSSPFSCRSFSSQREPTVVGSMICTSLSKSKYEIYHMLPCSHTVHTYVVETNYGEWYDRWKNSHTSKLKQSNISHEPKDIL